MRNPDTPSTAKEIEIRGRLIMLSCDIEFCLLNIILFCNPDPNNHERAGEFKGLKMGGKIEKVVCDMKKYKPAYYDVLKGYFDGLAEFKEVRNNIAHHKGNFPNDPDLDVFEMLFVRHDENNVERIAFISYTDEQIEGFIERFYNINGALSALWMKLKQEFDLLSENHPFVYPSTDNG